MPWQGAGSLPALMVLRNQACWRVKATAGPASSAMEVALGKLFQLTGLLAPDTELVGTLQGLPGPGPHVGSRYEEGFKDLGDFLASDTAAELVHDTAARSGYDALRAAHQAALADNAALLQSAGVDWWALKGADADRHARTDQARFDALQAMNRMLPVELRCEQLRHYVVSRWLANWDQLNYRLENFGYTTRGGAWVGMSLDFGSSGPLGYRDLQTGAMLPKRDAGEVAVQQRPPSLFPIPPAFVGNIAKFDAFRADPGLLHDTRTWPYGFQSESVAALFRPPVAADPTVIATLAEMGYRLALLPAGAIAEVIARHWPPSMEAAQGWPGAEALATRLLARRDALLARFDPLQIHDWISADPPRAELVRRTLVAALEGVLGPDAAHSQATAQAHAALLRAGRWPPAAD